MLGEIVTTSALIAGGQLADHLGTRRLRLSALKVLRSASHLDWHRFVAQQAWRAYTIVFGRKSSSAKFHLRSAIAYALLFIGSLLFLAAYFPLQSQIVTSVFYYGNGYEIAGWVVAALLGLPLYTLANAQTLYFLEILKTAPSSFKFLLVAYADFLITGSIALFGVPALMLVSSGFALYGARAPVNVKIEFKQTVQSPSIGFLENFGASIDDEVRDRIIDLERRTFQFEVDYRVLPSNVDLSRKDFDLTKSLISKGEIEGVEYHSKTGSIRVIDDSGSVVGFRERDLAFRDSVGTFEVLKKTETVRGRRLEFCKEFSQGHRTDIPYVLYDLSAEQQSKIEVACLEEKIASLTIPVSINRDNVDYGGTYQFFLNNNLADLLRSLGSGFRSYLALSPFTMLAPNEQRGGWWHTHRIGEINDRTAVAMDKTMSSALYTELGGYNAILNKAFAAGTVNFAIMSTAAFNVIVMGFLIIFYPIYMFARNSRTLSRYAAIRKFPFTTFGIIASVYLLLLTAVIGG